MKSKVFLGFLLLFLISLIPASLGDAARDSSITSCKTSLCPPASCSRSYDCGCDLICGMENPDKTDGFSYIESCQESLSSLIRPCVSGCCADPDRFNWAGCTKDHSDKVIECIKGKMAGDEKCQTHSELYSQYGTQDFANKLQENCQNSLADCKCPAGYRCDPASAESDPYSINGCVYGTGLCGNGICDNPKYGVNASETCATCPQDCPCTSLSYTICKPSDPTANGYGCIWSEAQATVEICDNDRDDDNDLLADCDDPDCMTKDVCYFKVTGQIATGGGNPLRQVEIRLLDSNSDLIESSFTDDNGRFMIDYTVKAQGLDLPADASLQIALQYKNGQFKIVWDLKTSNQLYTIKTTKFTLPTKTDFDMALIKSDPIWSVDNYITTPGWDSHWDAGKIYYDTLRAFEFVKQDLGYGFNGGGNTMPLPIYIYTADTAGAFYDPSHRGGGVFIAPRYSRHDNTLCPENCAWHELFHFIMYNKYGEWSSYGSKGENHAGFKNNNTGDSYEEAYAEFWPNILSQEMDGDSKAIYAGLWPMELNYNPWTNYGEYEEFAISTLFWDLIDSNQDTGDKVTVPYKDLWNVLMGKKLQSLKEVYAAIQSKWPDKAADINEAFVAHGLFKDTFSGNSVYDPFEPFWDEAPAGGKPNNKWDPGEVFIDIGTPDDGLPRPHQIYTPGQDIIGTATNYARPGRQNKPLAADSFVKIGPTSNGAPIKDALFKVSYSFSDPSLNYETYGVIDNETGYAYVEIPPDAYPMTATITIDNYENSGSITVNSSDYYSKDTQGRGYMKSGAISAGSKKQSYCNNDRVCQPAESRGCSDCPLLTSAAGAPVGDSTGGSAGGTGQTGITQPGTGNSQGQSLSIDEKGAMEALTIVAMVVVPLVILLIIVVIIKHATRKH